MTRLFSLIRSGALMTALAAAPIFAQNPNSPANPSGSPSGTPSENPATAPNPSYPSDQNPTSSNQEPYREPRGDHNFGWIGLLGLAGLAGLMSRRPDTRNRTTTETRTPPRV
jgi:hypothetical protein